MRKKAAIAIAGCVLACVTGAAWWFWAGRLPPPTALVRMSAAERAAAIEALRRAEEPEVGEDGGAALRGAIGTMQGVIDGPNFAATTPYFDLELSALPVAAGSEEMAARQVIADAGVFEQLDGLGGAGWASVEDSGAVGPLGGPPGDGRAARYVVRVLAIEMKLAAASGDSEALAAQFERALLVGRGYALQLETLPWLLAGGMRALAFNAVVDLAAAGQIDADEAERLLAVVDRDRGMPGAEAALRAVAIRESAPQGLHAMLYPADLRRAGPGIEASRDELIALIGTPSRLLPPRPGESEVLEDRFPGAGLLPEPVRPAERLDMADAYRSSALLVLTTANGALQSDRACRIALAMERYRGEHGAYPESLESLGLPREVLSSPVTGERVALRMLGAPDEKGRFYVLDWGHDAVAGAGR